MEIPVINRMTDQFEASISSLNNPSLITRLFSLFELGKHLSLPHRVWKWGALFLALAYAFSSVAYRLKALILYYHGKSKSLLATASEPLLSHFEEDFSSSDEDDVVSSSEEEEEDDDSEEEDEDDDDRSSSYEDLTRFGGDDFRVKGSFGNFGQKGKFNLRRRRSICDNFSLSDLVSGNGVVKLWENSILGEIQLPAVAMMSPSVVVSAVSGGDDGLFGLWDLRMGRRSPVVRADWKPVRRGNKSVGIDVGRTGKVYVRDGVSEVVGDLRKMDTPLEEDTWWDTVGVAVKEE